MTKFHHRLVVVHSFIVFILNILSVSLSTVGSVRGDAGRWDRLPSQYTIYEHNRSGFRVQYGPDRELRGKHPKINEDY